MPLPGQTLNQWNVQECGSCQLWLFWCNFGCILGAKNFNNFQKLDYSLNSDNLIKKESLGLLEVDGTQLQLGI